MLLKIHLPNYSIVKDKKMIIPTLVEYLRVEFSNIPRFVWIKTALILITGSLENYKGKEKFSSKLFPINSRPIS